MTSSNTDVKYDVIVIGAGHNGLTNACYLARAGLKVLVLEQRSVVGGLCTDYEFFPGYHSSIPNSPGSLEPKVVADLELKKFGLEFTRPDPSLVVPFPDGRAMVAWRDREKTAKEITKFSQTDVIQYAKLFEYLNDFGARLKISLFEPPPSLRDVLSRLETPEDEDAFAKVVLGSLTDLLDNWLESPEMKAVIAAISATSNLVGPSTPGTPYLLLMRPLSMASNMVETSDDPRKQYLRGSTGLPIGGMGSVTRAMRLSLEAHGGVVRTECKVSRIVATQNGVQGVELESGEFIPASIVSSNLHPKTTLIDLLDLVSGNQTIMKRVDQLPKRGSAFKIALKLDGLPVFAAAPVGLEATYSGCQFRLSPTLEYMDRAYDDAKYGAPSQNPIILGLIPSVADPSMAPPGKHILSANAFHAPVELKGTTWAAEREKFGLRCIDIMAQYMPNLKECISDYKFLSPLDLEEEFGLRDANIMHVDMMPAHMFGLRPVPGISSYKMPVKGLYLCGSGTWPGGTVSGVPGYNASRQILCDMQTEREVEHDFAELESS
ncbi:NAD(P)/FAD-dependent oxidoreductase [Planktomarina sp.]|nr:NAD(P)/FAD-dependent oxidoreductase [Planktomarina sp.]